VLFLFLSQKNLKKKKKTQLTTPTQSETAPCEVVVFPEDSLYGPAFPTRAALAPFARVAPALGTDLAASCAGEIRAKSSSSSSAQAPVFCAIAAAAVRLQAAVVASFAERGGSDTAGAGQYNAAVAVSRTGVVAALYRKVHTYHEAQFDNGTLPQPAAVFDTPGGLRVALAICNDATHWDSAAAAV
jgi:predicted amidohydrolase